MSLKLVSIVVVCHDEDRWEVLHIKMLDDFLRQILDKGKLNKIFIYIHVFEEVDTQLVDVNGWGIFFRQVKQLRTVPGVHELLQVLNGIHGIHEGWHNCVNEIDDLICSVDIPRVVVRHNRRISLHFLIS